LATFATAAAPWNSISGDSYSPISPKEDRAGDWNVLWPVGDLGLLEYDRVEKRLWTEPFIKGPRDVPGTLSVVGMFTKEAWLSFGVPVGVEPFELDEGVTAGDVERSWSGLGANERGFRLLEVGAAPAVIIVGSKVYFGCRANK